MSKSTITNIKLVLKGMYKTALRHKFVSEDVSALMIADYSSEQKRPHTPFNDDEIQILWQHQGEFCARLLLILIYTGMRINELLSIKSDSVFLDRRYMVGGLKTKAGKNRQIPIAEKIAPFFDLSHEYLITDIDGKKLSYGKANKDLELFMYALNMQHTFHDTRHTCASLLERAGVSSLHRKLILGHSSKDITDHYTHVDIKDLIKDINKI